ncbi:putative MFS-type transporter yfiS (plasmid) [Fibrella aestuarina BUZ 2]|uniref:Putative MFS-type transporter yfiS n=1 Tax=Fibrella aestuarina BUZ 2 TaxID=1166018 RepID=I0KHN7_9BACT|nr:MFS transporter [Fibrella aestuarina]CCH03640.1 putative MFS-type transporter yfiS [Fibrella aestuarina BUZ 2]
MIQTLFAPFASLRNRAFARLYTAETISLVGDAFTWVGIALLAYNLAKQQAATILATALTLRVSAFILFAPLAGVWADRYARQTILITTHVGRMIVVGLFPFVTQTWQVYGLIVGLNIFNAFFTPAYKATIPQFVTNPADAQQAITLSNTTYQLLGVLGPGLAGSLAGLIGVQQLFWLDALSFLLAGVLIATLPQSAWPKLATNRPPADTRLWQDVRQGTQRLFGQPAIRFALLMELTAALAGAQILVNTVGLVKGELGRDDQQYGWVMSGFGVGATLAAFGVSMLTRRFSLPTIALIGALVTGIAIIPAHEVSFTMLVVGWAVAGVGQSLAEMPNQFLIAERIPPAEQGRVYGAHFAWSHAWWAIGYPLAGWLGGQFSTQTFWLGGLVALSCWLVTLLIFKRT